MKDNIKETIITIYSSTTSNKGESISLFNALENIKNNTYKKEILELREEENIDIQKKLKSKLPPICFGGSFSHRKTVDIESKCLMLDFDNIENVMDVKRKIVKEHFVISCFISPRGNGLKLLVYCEDANELNYKAVINQVFKLFKDKYRLEVDTSKQNINDLCYVSYDPNTYLNWKPNSFKYKKETVLEKPKYLCPKLEPYIKQLEEKKLDITQNHKDWVKVCFAIATEYREDGRDYFHRVSKYYPEYDRTEANKQYNSCLKSNREGITISTLYYFLKQAGIEVNQSFEELVGNLEHNLWYKCTTGIKMDFFKVFQLLKAKGVRLFQQNQNSNTEVVQVKNNIVTLIDKEGVFKIVSSYIKSIECSDFLKSQFTNAFLKSTGVFLTKTNIHYLDTLDKPFVTDTPKSSFFFYSNGCIEVTKNDISLKLHSDLKGLIWNTQIVEHEIQLEDIEKCKLCIFNKFLLDISRNENTIETEKRHLAIQIALGYLLHGYKDPRGTKAIILSDASLDDNAGGRGKGIIIQAIKKVRATVIEDGKQFKQGPFAYSNINPDTKIYALDDIRKNFEFEGLFSLLTGDWVIQKKYQNKSSIDYMDSPKVLISTNNSIYGEGTSHDRRKFEFELSETFGINHTPEDKYGLLFSWESEEWNRFYIFMMLCVKNFLTKGKLSTVNSICSTEKKLRQTVSIEFIAFMEGLSLDHEFNKKTMLEEFKRSCDYRRDLFQKSFTKWIHLYCEARGLELSERKSNNNYLFSMTKPPLAEPR